MGIDVVLVINQSAKGRTTIGVRMNKSKLLSVTLAMLSLGAASAFAEIKINDNLSTSGFLDMSIYGKTPDKGPKVLNASFDQFELDFMYKFGFFSARADINALPSANPPLPGAPAGNTSAVYLEQGFITCDLGSGASLGMGRFLSTSGFEAAEPTGLNQYSVSKLLNGYAGPTYGYYQNGLNLSYSSKMFGLYGAVVSDLWDPQEFDLKTPGFEGQVSVMPMEGVTAKATYLYQVYDDPTPAKHDNQSEINVWAQYANGPITVAAEYSHLMDWKVKDESGDGWLAMANYKFTDKIAGTLRYSGIKMKSPKDPDTEITLSPSFAVSPNWLVLAEFRQNIDAKVTEYAAESTFSF